MFFNGTQNISESLLKNTPHFPPLNNKFNNTTKLIKHRVLFQKLREKRLETQLENYSHQSKDINDCQQSKVIHSSNQKKDKEVLIKISESNDFKQFKEFKDCTNFNDIKNLKAFKNSKDYKDFQDIKDLKEKQKGVVFKVESPSNPLDTSKDYKSSKPIPDSIIPKVSSSMNHSKKNTKRRVSQIFTNQKIDSFHDFIGNSHDSKNSNSLDPKIISSRIAKYATQFKNLAFQMMNNIQVKKDLCKIQFTQIVRNRAAAMIQKNYRGFKVRNKYRNVNIIRI